MKPSGFTLIELLAVMAIISILSVLAVLSLGASRGANVTSAAHMVEDTLNFARQLAVTQNRMTEVRFYETSTAAQTYSALRIEIYDVTGANPVPASPITFLPTGIVMVSTVNYSTLLSPTTNASSSAEALPVVGSTPYTAFQFRPSGATSLNALGASPSSGTTDQWFVSLKLASDPAVSALPAHNFATVQIDPVSGRTTLYQP